MTDIPKGFDPPLLRPGIAPRPAAGAFRLRMSGFRTVVRPEVRADCRLLRPGPVRSGAPVTVVRPKRFNRFTRAGLTHCSRPQALALPYGHRPVGPGPDLRRLAKRV